MNIVIKPLGCSEEQLNNWKKKGFSYDKRTARQMLEAFKKESGASLDAINELELIIGASLPRDYKEFMLKYDGGVPEPAAFDIQEESNSSVVKAIFGLETPLVNSSVKYNIDLYKNRIPNDFMPIGSDAFGNRIVLGVRDKWAGKIFFWDHERESDEVGGYYGNIFLISNSFEDFLLGLREQKEI